VLAGCAYLAFAVFEVHLFRVNRRTFRIPDRILLRAAAVALTLLVPAALLAGEPIRIAQLVVGALTAFVTVLIPHLIWPRDVGFGNVKEAAYVGLHLGFAAAGVGSAAAVAAISTCVGCVLVAALLFVRIHIAHNRSSFATTTAPWILLGLLPTAVVLRPFDLG
jgi:leader peptidase (prepilin peptidase)/N-methyltransferase